MALPGLLLLLLAPVAAADDPPVPQDARPVTRPVARWQGVDGQPLPFERPEEIQDFLRRAPIVWKKQIAEGINQPLKVRLEQDGIAAHAVFRTVDERKTRVKIDGRILRDFHDSYIFECAAYELSLMLGLDNVPPCVKRRLGAAHGTLQLWIENALTEKKRRELGQDPPNSRSWPRQQQTMRLFDALIDNFDRNQGNILLDRRWKRWLIDHTRSFAVSDQVVRIDRIVWCERVLWDRLRDLGEEELRRRMAPFLDSVRIRMLIKRRNRLVEHLQARIDRLGENAVIYDLETAADSGLADAEIAVDSGDLPKESTPVEEVDRNF